MKKLYLLIILAALNFAASSQSLTATNIYFSGDPMYFVEAHATITNVSNSPKNVKVQRMSSNLVSGHNSYFCWVQCYTAQVSVSPDDTLLLPGGSVDIFRGDLETNSIPGVSVVSYCFFDMNNPGDSVCVEYTYPSPVGLGDVSGNNSFISKAYPNPASDVTNFYINIEKGSKSAHLKFFNMLGAQVKDIDVTGMKNSIKVNVSDLKAGIYFYSVWVDGKSTSTGKLMVSRN